MELNEIEQFLSYCKIALLINFIQFHENQMTIF
jgi:hypothetical protein